jgi:DNA-binding HxlR family transcriptional regulator
MTPRRHYRLACPIARGLDRIGDRWTLLILRDLHAGPGRFSDLQSGLAGIASNLLAERLQRLQDDGLIRRREAQFGVQVYELTELGQGTGALLLALAEFGAQFPPETDLVRPGNLRALALPLQMALQSVVPEDATMRVELQVDDEPFTVRVSQGQVAVRAGADPEATVRLALPIAPVLSALNGDPSAGAACVRAVTVQRADSADLERFMDWLSRGLSLESGSGTV